MGSQLKYATDPGVQDSVAASLKIPSKWKRNVGSKSQKQKERHAKKRQEKKKKLEQTRGRTQDTPTGWMAPPVGNNARRRERIAQQVPRGWEGETAEDVAVFDDGVLAKLTPELVQQVGVVRKALQDATEGRGEEALSDSSVIPRSSPLSEWRLFIRGLVEWLGGTPETAGEAWQRLDSERRPGRIAAVMMLGLRTDLEQAARPPVKSLTGSENAGNEPPATQWNQWDDQQLYHAKLLRRVRIDRAALSVAEVGLKFAEPPQKLLLGPKKLQWLKRFIQEHEDTEPDLTAALSRAALRRAFAQPYDDLFEQAIRTFPGPKHDRQNLLLNFFYYGRFDDDPLAEHKADEALERYLSADLPKNESLSKPLRGAISSHIHYMEAMSLMRPQGPAMLGFMFAPPEDQAGIRQNFKAAQKAYGGNRQVHKAYTEWLEDNLETGRLTPARRKALEKEQAAAMEAWSAGLPDDVEPRLWLVDFLLENEELEEAKPHVDFLAASRHDDPRVRATPWKWQLLEAMRLCRRKAWLPDSADRLDEAEKLWPTWLSKQWLPYLRAAYSLRAGQTEAYQTQRQQICEASGLARDSLADACMMLGAAQQMRVPADELKPLRLPVDQGLKNLKKLPMNDLVDAGGFFWDQHRTNLLYPAYRLHGAKFSQELVRRWKIDPQPVLSSFQEERIHKALLWCSEYRLWLSDSQTLPSFLSNKSVEKHPIFCAAIVNAYLKMTYPMAIRNPKELGPALREAAASERDPYYRFWFVKLAESFDEVLAEDSMPSFFSSMFGRGGFDSDDDEDDDDFGMNFDMGCDCEDCRAARKRLEQQQSSGSKKSP